MEAEDEEDHEDRVPAEKLDVEVDGADLKEETCPDQRQPGQELEEILQMMQTFVLQARHSSLRLQSIQMVLPGVGEERVG